MLTVAERVALALERDEVNGVVVTHGTDTVEETAFLCDLVIASDKPVAFAVAMRSGGELSADGPRNLLGAAQLANDPQARGLGVVVVLNDEVHAARWVRKQDTYRLSAFRSPDHGPLGRVLAGSVRVLVRPARLRPLRRPAALNRPVPVIRTYTGMEEHLIGGILDATAAAGLVIEGTGLGNVPGAAEPGIRAAIDRGLPVVVATSAPAGGTDAVYGGAGGGATLAGLGVVQSGSLSAAKARLLLMLLLGNGASGADALQAFTATVRALA
jgi:L-asparaginase